MKKKNSSLPAIKYVEYRTPQTESGLGQQAYPLQYRNGCSCQQLFFFRSADAFNFDVAEQQPKSKDRQCHASAGSTPYGKYTAPSAIRQQIGARKSIRFQMTQQPYKGYLFTLPLKPITIGRAVSGTYSRQNCWFAF